MSNGVVHIGAHNGEEVSQYLAEGRSPIICFEPQSQDAFPDGAELVSVAIGIFTGTLNLHIPHHIDSPTLDTMLASALPLIPANAIANGWTPTPCETVTIPVVRFDEWASANGFEHESCPLLVIDVEGSEMEVLRSFGPYLDGFSELVVECSEPAIWEGGSTASEIVAYLETRGLTATTPIIRHGDIHFERKA